MRRVTVEDVARAIEAGCRPESGAVTIWLELPEKEEPRVRELLEQIWRESEGVRALWPA